MSQVRDSDDISKLTKKFPAYITFPGFFMFYAKFGKSESRLPWVCYIFGSNSASNSDHKVNIVRFEFRLSRRKDITFQMFRFVEFSLLFAPFWGCGSPRK